MATPLPPPSPRHLRLLRLLLSGLVLGAALRGAAAGHPDVAACPGSLDCALKRRARCPPGAHACGPCLQPFQEDQQGLCVPRMRRPPGGGRPQPRLEDEIDFLAQELARKESGHSTPPLPKARQRLPEPVLILAFCVAGAAALSVASLCWCRLQREIRLTQKADYATAKAPGSPAAPRISPGDQRLAHSAEMYHYQHQRQQMLCLERHKEPPKELDTASSDEENEDGDFTVYECPGLAPTGEMEVRNPLFDHAALSAPLPAPSSPPALP
ncbi:neural proliferation differentiation and control protein 1 isoform X3 [Pan troglodytes]|uniref:neural proliferation differentiation and control protein 1 isoform X3 n=1 Tax=Pan troglodytes TaxID=9598 RepID=UPI0007DBB67E|nr:neural proliferation differentiation and control protein 1 isoform X3 [Pan troglodytes]